MSYKRSDIRIYDDLNSLAEAFTSEIIKEINNQLKNKERINIALSGGNTPKAFFSVVRKEKVNWKKIFLFWGDERCVPPDDKESNFGMTKKYLLDHIKIPDENINRILGENDPYDEAKRYSEIINTNLIKVNGIPSFEVIILGLGDDGHTASIFPNQLNLLNSNENCEVAEHPVTKQKRITLTGKIINNSQKIFFLVNGENKSQIVSDFLKGKRNYLKYPAYYIKPLNGEVVWFLDKDAASAIN